MNTLSSILKFIGNRLAQIQGGSIPGTVVAANSYTDVAITFPKAYDAVPAVICTIYSSSTAGAIGSFTVSAINITKTGFTARFFNDTSSDRTPAGRYVAIPMQ